MTDQFTNALQRPVDYEDDNMEARFPGYRERVDTRLGVLGWVPSPEEAVEYAQKRQAILDNSFYWKLKRFEKMAHSPMLTESEQQVVGTYVTWFAEGDQAGRLGGIIQRLITELETQNTQVERYRRLVHEFEHNNQNQR